MTDPRAFGSTGRQFAPLGFGCMTLVGWYGERNDAEASATLLAACDLGIVHFDTASNYQDGASERFVGEVLGDTLRARREQFFIASKYGVLRDAAGAISADNRPESLRRAVTLSLEHLGLDYLDLYYLHRIDRTVPIEDSVGELARLVARGLIRHIGLSECSVATLERACATYPIAAVQSEYSLWSRDQEEAGMIAACARLGAAFVAYSPLGRGFLAGAFRALEQLPTGDVRRNQPRFKGEALANNLRAADALQTIAVKHGCTMAQLAIAWVLAQDPCIHTIPGTKRRERLRENFAALALPASAPALAEAQAAIAAVEVQGTRQPEMMMRQQGV
jgi:aryl-alcohol dehydrogenase-like predicted oxidoreductase